MSGTPLVSPLERRDSSPLWRTLNLSEKEDQREVLCRRIAQLGCDLTSYYERLRLAYRDFAIVCHQRTGSHFLAAAINNHSEICCQGELLQLIIAPQKDYAPECQIANEKINGAIIMYNQWEIAKALNLTPANIIHLHRDPQKTALSIIRNEIHASLHGVRHSPHELRDGTDAGKLRNYSVEKKQMDEWTSSIRQEQVKFNRDFSILESRLDISYEELCADRDVNEIDSTVAAKIIEFLKASRVEPLVTSLRKTSSP